MLGTLERHDVADDRSNEHRSIEVDATTEAAELRDRALRLLAVGVGDHTLVKVREQVGEIARRLAQLEPPVDGWS